jgi:hypothetical protein
MNDTLITCPNCGHRFPVTEALAAQVHTQIETALRADFEARQRAAVAQAQASVREEAARERKLLEVQLAQQQQKTREAQEAELALRKEKSALDERSRELDLEVARKLDAEKAKLEQSLRRSAAEEQALTLRKKDQQIDDLTKLVDEMKRKSELGSQERQGEVLEVDIQAALEAHFPHDLVRPVPKGMQGADPIQEVRDATLAPCGSIVWEVKNTRHFQPAWIAKLKDDQRACGGAVAVLVSVALPEGVRGFGQVHGVWVAGLDVWPALAAALREQLIQVAFARNAATGMNDKMEALYRYLAGDAFRHKVEAIVEAFTALRAELDRERRAMEKLWKEREKQLDRIIVSTAGMYGELRGTIGQALAPIASLELDDGILPDALPRLPGQ